MVSIKHNNTVLIHHRGWWWWWVDVEQEEDGEASGAANDNKSYVAGCRYHSRRPEHCLSTRAEGGVEWRSNRALVDR